MNKRIIAALLALGVLAASNAFASRARDIVMGSGDTGNGIQNGSLYYDTAYNIFYNPAYINDFKNWATIEKSNFSNTGTAGTKGQGGFAASVMNWNVGFYFNRTAGITGVNNGGGIGVAQAHSNAVNYRPIDIIFGGEMGPAKVGLGLTYGSTETPTANGQDITLRVGAEYMEFEPFFGIKVNGDDKSGGLTTANTYKDISAGARYHWGEWVPYFDYHHMGYDRTGVTANISENAWGIGMGRNVKVNEGVSMNYAVSYWRDSTNNTGADYTRSSIPIDFSVEGDATGWLSLRAGLQYRLYDKVTGSGSQNDTTFGRLGATIHVKKVDFDWAVGKTGGLTGSESATDTGSQNFDIGEGFFTAAALSYHW